jgi:hypothetical protein
VRLLGSYHILACPFYKPYPLQKAALNSLTLKFLVFTGFGLLFFFTFAAATRETRRSYLGLALLLTDRFSLLSITAYHTYRAGVHIPSGDHRLAREPGPVLPGAQNRDYPLLVGLLMLGRQNYFAYQAII